MRVYLALGALLIAGGCESQYQFQKNTAKRVLIYRNALWVATIDEGGNLIPVEPFLLPKRPLPADFDGDVSKLGDPYEGVPEGRPVNLPRKGEEFVYEYRSGSLIKGQLDSLGNFVPEPNSTIEKFADYKYGKDAVRIYNLPGDFVKK